MVLGKTKSLSTNWYVHDKVVGFTQAACVVPSGLKNATAVDVLSRFVESGKLKPYVQEYFPLADVAMAFNISAAGGVVGASKITVASESARNEESVECVWCGRKTCHCC